MKKEEIIFLALIIILAVSLRLYNLENKWYGTDEKHSLLQGERIINNLSLETLKKDAHPPLFFSFIGLLKKITNSDYLVRITLILISLITIIITYFFVRESINEKTAKITAIILTLSPFHILYSHHIRAYIIIMLLFLISTYLLYKLLFKDYKKSIYILPFVYIVSFYSHIFSAFYILAHLIAVIYFKYKHQFKYFKEYLISFSISCLAMALWIPIFLKQYIFIVKGDNIAIEPLKWYFLPYPFYKYSIMMDVKTVMNNYPTFFIISFLITLLFIYGIYKLYKENKKLTEFLSLCFFPIFIIMGIIGTKVEIYSFRYVSYLFPIYTLFLSAPFDLKKKYHLAILAVVIITWLIIMNYYYSVMHIKLWNDLFAI